MSGLYKKTFEEFDLNIIEPKDIDKQTLMSWIYDVKSSKYNITSIEFESSLREYIDHVSILAKCCVDLAQGNGVYEGKVVLKIWPRLLNYVACER